MIKQVPLLIMCINLNSFYKALLAVPVQQGHMACKGHEVDQYVFLCSTPEIVSA